MTPLDSHVTLLLTAFDDLMSVIKNEKATADDTFPQYERVFELVNSIPDIVNSNECTPEVFGEITNELREVLFTRAFNAASLETAVRKIPPVLHTTVLACSVIAIAFRSDPRVRFFDHKKSKHFDRFYRLHGKAVLES